MMISPEVMQELLSVRQVLHYLPESASSEKGWAEHEQHLFWVALAQHPEGPWTTIAEFIGTKSARQAMTHGQKLRQKLKRWNERLRSNPTASMLMDEVNVSTSTDLSVTADISVRTTESTDVPVSGTFQPTVAFTELSSGVVVDDVSIVEMDGVHLSGTTTEGMSLPMMCSHDCPHVSAATTRVVELMLSEFSEEVVVTDFADEPEILPQDLLDDLLDILSDDDLNELNNHHQNPSTL
ncbi:hypothetical protein P3T76_011323 [Phytophthora citrophthora]|uniref:Myb-like domain-containing protein n=1 Tax=Phytophthora citrophthora TaxID=4793 RepID=A0AAD9G977_9STRA|nr:hypothetical protein P3T76_011323 [Phytophthora citrophthora]